MGGAGLGEGGERGKGWGWKRDCFTTDTIMQASKRGGFQEPPNPCTGLGTKVPSQTYPTFHKPALLFTNVPYTVPKCTSTFHKRTLLFTNVPFFSQTQPTLLFTDVPYCPQMYLCFSQAYPAFHKRRLLSWSKANTHRVSSETTPALFVALLLSSPAVAMAVTFEQPIMATETVWDETFGGTLLRCLRALGN